jgi:hypothetical protein
MVVEFLSAACKFRYYRRSPDLEHNETPRPGTDWLMFTSAKLENPPRHSPIRKTKSGTQNGDELSFGVPRALRITNQPRSDGRVFQPAGSPANPLCRDRIPIPSPLGIQLSPPQNFRPSHREQTPLFE